MRLTLRVSLALILANGVACHDSVRTTTTGLLEISVEADPLTPLGGVPIRIDGKPSGATGADGTLRVPVIGDAGRVLRIEPTCPDGHHAPREAERFRIRRYHRDRLAPIHVTLVCRPVTRIAAFVVRAKNGAHLPIRLNDELVGETNSSGVAHFSMRGRPGSEYVVELDARGDSNLLPRSAVAQFRLPDANTLFVVAPSFQYVDPVRKSRRHRRRIIKIE